VAQLGIEVRSDGSKALLFRVSTPFYLAAMDDGAMVYAERTGHVELTKEGRPVSEPLHMGLGRETGRPEAPYAPPIELNCVPRKSPLRYQSLRVDGVIRERERILGNLVKLKELTLKYDCELSVGPNKVRLLPFMLRRSGIILSVWNPSDLPHPRVSRVDGKFGYQFTINLRDDSRLEFSTQYYWTKEKSPTRVSAPVDDSLKDFTLTAGTDKQPATLTCHRLH
jgi:hypothetical protein